MAKVREIAWPDEYSDLKRMEELMVCGICYEYMDTSVMTPCSHNYCSLCIRKYLHYKAQCPACFQVFFEKDLYINRVMDSLIQYYLQIREKIINLVENRAVYNKIKGEPCVKQEPPSTPPIRPARNNQLPRSPKILEINNEPKISEPKTPSIRSPFASTSKCSVSSPSASSPSTSKSISAKEIPTIAQMFNTPKRKVVNVKQVEKPKSVPCPVCKVEIPEYTVNMHLDACLQRENQEKVKEEKEKLKEKFTKKRPPLPKLVLRVMKDAELRKKMKELGLSTQGDRRALESRFTRYSTIYNTECDKIDPRPIGELIKQCEAEERQERHMTSFLVSAAALQRLQIEKNAKEEKIEEAQKNYRENHKSSFDKLIEEVRNRRKMEKERNNQQNNEVDSSTNKPSTSENAEIVSENITENDENAISNPSAEIVFEDSNSDSDENCPLQHYENINDCSSSASTSPIKRPQRTRNSNKNKTKESMPLKIANPYEMPTDESTDEDVPSSPVLNINTNRKRVKLNDKLLSRSSSHTLTSSETTNDSTEDQNREAKARDLCNSIIHDFSCDDSSSEFADKPPKQIKTIEEEERNHSFKINESVNQHDLQKINILSCDKKVPETNLNGEIVTNNLNNSFEDFSFDILNADSSNDCLDTRFNESQSLEQTVNKILNTSIHNNDEKVQKENNAATANENSLLSEAENTVRRPVRKRNRPIRFAETQNEKDCEKITNKESEELYDSESPDNLRNSASSDSSLKRRRGRTKINPTDELQNPPKRPVRRRQGASDRNLC